MYYIIKRRIKQLADGKRLEPVVTRVNRPVLYANEARSVICEYVAGIVPLCDIAGTYALRVVKKRGENSYYWMLNSLKLSCAVKIAPKSEIAVLLTEKMPIFFEELPMSMTIDILLKDCSCQTNEDTSLFARMLYDADERVLTPSTLYLRGVKIKNFPHDYWDVQTLTNTPISTNGCTGFMTFETTSTIVCGEPVRTKTESQWTGEKTLKIFSKEEDSYEIKRMLKYWESFWKTCGY